MTATQTAHAVVSREEWLQARKALLNEEKAHTRRRDELSRKRRELPWVNVKRITCSTELRAASNCPIFFPAARN